MKKIVLISTGQPATNPRLVKEADALTAAGYDVTILYSHVIDWASAVERKSFQNVLWKPRLVGGSPSQRILLYFFTRLRFRLAQGLNRYFGASVTAERAQARSYDEMLKAAKEAKADLYIGHNLGALPVAVRAATANGAKAGFDFEDYHRGEFGENSPDRQRIIWLENKYVPHLSYYSSSSPMIAEAVGVDHSYFAGKKLTLLNCFPPSPKVSNVSRKNDEGLLKLFWFSQTIGSDRGLETVISAMAESNEPNIRLTLVGRCPEQVKEQFRKDAATVFSSIIFAGVLPPDEIPLIAAQHDVGIASETGEPKNRDLCLTNKIFTYLSAGLCIVASDTSAQKALLKEHPGMGLLYNKNEPKSLASILLTLHGNSSLLERCKISSQSYCRERLNWKVEKDGLIRLVQELASN